MTAREGVGRLVVGVEFALNLVAQVIGEDSGFSEVEACLPNSGGGFSPGVPCSSGDHGDWISVVIMF
jgi:hypothetical protein